MINNNNKKIFKKILVCRKANICSCLFYLPLKTLPSLSVSASKCLENNKSLAKLDFQNLLAGNHPDDEMDKYFSH